MNKTQKMLAKCFEHQAWEFDDQGRKDTALEALVAVTRASCGLFDPYTVPLWEVYYQRQGLWAISIKEGS